MLALTARKDKDDKSSCLAAVSTLLDSDNHEVLEPMRTCVSLFTD